MLALLAACEQKPSSVTKLSGTVPEGDTIENVIIMTWVEVAPDTLMPKPVTVPVVDSRFEAEIPTCTSEYSSIRGSMRSIPFVADGTTLTVDLGAPIITSSSKKGVQSRYLDYIKWVEAIPDEMNEKAASLQSRHEAGEDVLLSGRFLRHTGSRPWRRPGGPTDLPAPQGAFLLQKSLIPLPRKG